MEMGWEGKEGSRGRDRNESQKQMKVHGGIVPCEAPSV